MNFKDKEIIDIKRRQLIKSTAMISLSIATTGFITSISKISEATELKGAQDKATKTKLPPGVPKGLPPELFDNTPLVPTQVFDNLYCIGSRSVVAWALKTSDGIILIDSMWDDRDAKLILDGMKELGLEPAEIKYIIITHGHGDHYGGAKYIQNKTDAKIIMTEVDFNYMNSSSKGANGPRSPKPSIVDFVNDGDKIVLGDTSVDIVVTPGHTPGCISLIFPVEKNGKTYTVAQWGGSGYPHSLDEKIAYRNSIDNFEKHANDSDANAQVFAHLFVQNGYSKLKSVRESEPESENPFIIGKKGLSNYFDSLRQSIDKSIATQKG